MGLDAKTGHLEPLSALMRLYLTSPSSSMAPAPRRALTLTRLRCEPAGSLNWEAEAEDHPGAFPFEYVLDCLRGGDWPTKGDKGYSGEGRLWLGAGVALLEDGAGDTAPRDRFRGGSP